MLAAIAAARFAARALTHRTALGSPAPRAHTWIADCDPVGARAASLAFACGGLALVADLEGPAAVAALLGADDALALCAPGSCTSDESTVSHRAPAPL